ncbi:MAG: DUF2148 domain-containing protein [Syntrophotaleaceae bacterium]
MLNLNIETHTQPLIDLVQQLCVAARTAPKARGRDLLVTALISGTDKNRLADTMREIAIRDNVAFFERDAQNIDDSPVVVLVGSKKSPAGLPHCGFCGFKDCQELEGAGGVCSFNSGDLGIALGSAVSRAADLRLDNRVMYSAGKAALELKLLGAE